MGLDADAKLIIAIPIAGWATFFDKTGEATLCPHGHKPDKAGQKFCPSDGKPFETKPVWKAKPVFAKAAKREDQSPSDFYESLRECYDDEEPGIRSINGLQSSEDRTTTLGFGVAIEGPGLQGGHKANLTWARLAELKATVEEEARKLGIEGEALPFLCLYVSC